MQNTTIPEQRLAELRLECLKIAQTNAINRSTNGGFPQSATDMLKEAKELFEFVSGLKDTEAK